jgi:hypothetical protein
MALRTNLDSVKKLIETDPEEWEGTDGVDLETCMTTANAVVTNVCAVKGVYTDELLELIERWLSAHYYGVISPSNGRVTVEQVASLKEQYSFKVGLGLDQTVYGQMAKTLDYNRYLKSLELPPTRVGKVMWLGGRWSEADQRNIPDIDFDTGPFSCSEGG